MTKKVMWGAGLALLLGGCGGDSPVTKNGLQEGIYRGTYVDADGATLTIETEQYHRNGKLTGTVRITSPDKIYHGQLSGSATANGASWTADLGRDEGTISVSVSSTGQVNMDASGQLKDGTGSLAREAAATTDNIAGAYTLTWTGNGGGDNFELDIVNVNGVDTIPYQYVKLPDNGGFVMSGSVVGSTISVTYFTAAGTDGFLAKFKPTVLGQQGDVSFQLIAGQNSQQFSGSWSLAKMN